MIVNKNKKPQIIVALRKESVDRNRSMPVAYRDAIIVALLAESVDRNIELLISGPA